MKIDELYTPCLILDKGKLDANIARMRNHLSGLGVNLRPHVKTAKSLPVAMRCGGGKIGPITVSTLREAEYFADGGFTDIIYAVSIVPAKLPRAKVLMDKGVDLKMIIDDADVAKDINAFGEREGCVFKLLIEIDSDMHRAGLSPDAPEVVEVAHIIDQGSGSELMGVLTHAGASYGCKNNDEMVAMAEQERSAITLAAQNIENAGCPCPIVSCGSTPTATFARQLDGVSEVRAGIFVFNDAVQAGLGTCTIDDISLNILTTVISHKKNQNRLLTDAGGLALSKDQGTRGTSYDCGYGLVADMDGNLIDVLFVDGANQEHGLITCKTGEIDFDKYPIGTKLRILPNHACMTAGAYEVYNVTNGSDEIIENWHRCNGW